ncbi:FkbM family methyltransferase [uncultured Microscilla sp.]|uniref:FkbM family methyltransferase n=1 Tax=uncultured Microscilla sp. TaxID=432653 RepID=UPI0026271D78|nr:FkbM family methyltransferase [uncultured Microscilla sp.]
MKRLTQVVHKTVLNLGLENAFAFLGKNIPAFTKFIPHPEAYQTAPERTVTRDGVKFNLTLTDFMQWHVFAHLPDYSWKKAAEYLQDQAHVLDVGANCGAFSLKLAEEAYRQKKQGTTIHAFDPNPYIVKKLEHNLSLNPRLQALVKVHAIGLGADNTTAPMAFSSTNTGGARVMAQGEQGKVMVPVQTIDSFVEEHQLESISFIKIDVEGYEPFVFLGAKQTIQKFRPAMYIEITDEWFKANGYSKEFIFEQLTKEGYRLLVETGHQFVDIATLQNTIDQIPQFNLLALPE